MLITGGKHWLYANMRWTPGRMRNWRKVSLNWYSVHSTVMSKSISAKKNMSSGGRRWCRCANVWLCSAEQAGRRKVHSTPRPAMESGIWAICSLATRRLPIWAGVKRKRLLPIGGIWGFIVSRIRKKENDVLRLFLHPKLFFGGNIIALLPKSLRATRRKRCRYGRICLPNCPKATVCVLMCMRQWETHSTGEKAR